MNNTCLIVLSLSAIFCERGFSQNSFLNSLDTVTYKSSDLGREVVTFIWPKSAIRTPFVQSQSISRITFTGRFANYTKADTWYPSWASDGNLYSPWTDGVVAGEKCFSFGETARTGQARIEGDDPMNLTVYSLGTALRSSAPYDGHYPCGSLVYNGIWYYGTYALAWADNYGLFNWPILGPFGGFRISHDMGLTWEQPPTSLTPGKTLFPEPVEFKGPLRIGAPHFVDFGKNMEHSPDGKAYLVGHGAVEQDMEERQANLSWISGDQIYICRVTPSPENINNEDAYEYFAGHDDQGEPIWSFDYADITPLIDWNNRTGCVTMTYNAPLKKYFMCVTDGWPTVRSMNTYILESDQITGPWSEVVYMENFGPQAYFVNIPSKFISEDGTTMWLCYSANFTASYETRSDLEYLRTTKPAGSAYALSLHEIELIIK